MAAKQPQVQPRAYSQAVLINGNNNSTGVSPAAQSQGRILQTASGARILCVADIRGNIRSLNELAYNARANYIIHTGDFGFYDNTSLDRVADKTLRHVAQFSPLLDDATRGQITRSPPQTSIKEFYLRNGLPLSELPEFLVGNAKLQVPVYTVWGACEDVAVLEKLRAGEYNIPNLHIIDEGHSKLLEVGEVKLRILGLGGALVMHKLFDNGEGRSTIAGGQGTMWSTLLQMGELIDNANRCYDPTETRLFVTHASPAREGLLSQLSIALKADFSISAGLHFRYGSSYNEFSVNPTTDHFRGKLAGARASFYDVWETVKHEVEPAVAENESQQHLLHQALDVISRMPSAANEDNPFGSINGHVDEGAFKNMWNFNLADASFGYLVLDIDKGRIGTEMRAQGFNFAHRSSSKAPSRGIESMSRPMQAQQLQNQQQQPQQLQNQTQQPSRQRPGAAMTAAQIASQSSGPTPIGQAPGAFSQQAPSSQKPAASPGRLPPPQGAGEDTRAEAGLSQGASRTAIFVPPLERYTTETMTAAIFSKEDQELITRIEPETKNRTHWVVYFKDHETMTAVLKRSPRKDGELAGRLELSAYRPPQGRSNRGGLQSGNWLRGRGGNNAGTNQNGTRAATVETENTRGGRGGRGGSMRGRGSDRGGRGRGGRGGTNTGTGKDGAASDAKNGAAAASTPVSATAPKPATGGDS